MNKSYSELSKLLSFEERFDYLKIEGVVGAFTFGGSRYLNQIFYNTSEWKSAKQKVILRDEGCDLGIPDRMIRGRLYVHHINPITIDDVIQRNPCLFNPENLICVSFNTHQAIHYGDKELLIPTKPIERTPGDQTPWRKEG